MSQKYQNHQDQQYDQHGRPRAQGHSCHHNHAPQKQSTLPPKSQAEQTSTVEEVVLMFRDQFGTILSQIERLFFALGHMKETEFRFHGYCRDRLVEYEPEFVALKLALSYRNMSNYHADMVGTFTSKEDRLTAKLFKLIPGAFHDRVDDLQEKLGAIKQTLKPEIVALLEQVLSSLNKKTYSELNPSVVPNIKTLQQTQPKKICPQTNQDELLRRVHQIQQDQEEIAKYQRDNRGKPPPDSAFVPATREVSYNQRSKSQYIGKPRQEQVTVSLYDPPVQKISAGFGKGAPNISGETKNLSGVTSHNTTSKNVTAKNEVEMPLKTNTKQPGIRNASVRPKNK